MDWETLVPVIVGGILGMGGGALGQLVTHRLTLTRELSKNREERIEKMVDAVWKHSAWLEEKRETVVFRKMDHYVPDPLEEARTIQGLYFPELLAAFHAVNKSKTSNAAVHRRTEHPSYEE